MNLQKELDFIPSLPPTGAALPKTTGDRYCRTPSGTMPASNRDRRFGMVEEPSAREVSGAHGRADIHVGLPN